MANKKFSDFASNADIDVVVGLKSGANSRITKAALKTTLGIDTIETNITAIDADITTIEAEQITQNAAIALNTAKRTYPLVDEQKLATIASGAEVNVNADWNAASGDAQILNKPTVPTVAGSTGQVQVNNAGALGASANLTFVGGVLQVTGFASFQNATATATTADTIAVDTNGFALTARSGFTDKLYGQRIKGTLTFNSANQIGYGLQIDLTTNATTSQALFPLSIVTSAASTATSELRNTSTDANAGCGLIIEKGANTRQKLQLVAKSGSGFQSAGIIFQDYENTNYWAVGTVDSDYLRIYHNNASATAGAVDPTMYIQNNRVAVGRYAASAIGATLDIRGEGTSTALGLRLRNASSVLTFHVRDDGRLNAPLLPTSSAGLSAGDIWNDAGTLKIV